MTKKFIRKGDKGEKILDELHIVNFGLLNKFLLDVQTESYTYE